MVHEQKSPLLEVEGLGQASAKFGKPELVVVWKKDHCEGLGPELEEHLHINKFRVSIINDDMYLECTCYIK